jgi:hypothetical protein
MQKLMSAVVAEAGSAAAWLALGGIAVFGAAVEMIG